MSCLNLTKKLLPSKRAWKSLTNTLQSKLHKLSIPRSIKKASHRVARLRSLPPILPRKRRRLSRRNHRYRLRHQQQQCSFHEGFSAVYVDKLFSETAPETCRAKDDVAASSSGAKATADRAAVLPVWQSQHVVAAVETKTIEEKKDLPRKSKAAQKSTYSVEDAWRAAVASSPQLRGVDERAEEFISKFREEMKLQREKSNLHFQEMLTRSA